MGCGKETDNTVVSVEVRSERCLWTPNTCWCTEVLATDGGRGQTNILLRGDREDICGVWERDGWHRGECASTLGVVSSGHPTLRGGNSALGLVGISLFYEDSAKKGKEE